MFKPNHVIFEKEALEYETGQALWEKFQQTEKCEVEVIEKNRVVIKGQDAKEKYEKAKRTLVVAVRKDLDFQSCKPSAHYQLPLVTGCMGMCEYCYLNTRLGNSNYIKIYVNIEEILKKAKQYIVNRQPEKTIFEGAATSDPIPIEDYTHNLAKAIEFFGKEPEARFRFVTKYDNIESLLNLNHEGHTEIRFSLNTERVIKDYEHRTASSKKRIEALGKVAAAGYPVGVLIAPVFLYENWKEEYLKLLYQLKNELYERKVTTSVSFEIITHRYTKTAKNRILEFYPDTTLPMEEEKRKFKYGQFGYGKYVYTQEELEEVKKFFYENIDRIFENTGNILYVI